MPDTDSTTIARKAPGPPVVVVGGGPAGVECALAVSRAMPGTDVTLVTERDSLVLVPNAVYVPLGEDPATVSVPLQRRLAAHGVAVEVGLATRVSSSGDEVHMDDGRVLAARAVIVASGTRALPTEGMTLRGLDDAIRLRGELAAIAAGERSVRRIRLRLLDESAWAPPAFELVMLLDTWLLAAGCRDDIDLRIESRSERPLAGFGERMSSRVYTELEARDVLLALGAPCDPPAADELVVDFGALRARELDGVGPPGPSGFYDVAPTGRVRGALYVVGDAAAHPFKAAFATTAQARAVAMDLGGDEERLGDPVDGVAAGECEYQMDLGVSTLAVRMPASPDGAVPAEDEVVVRLMRSAPEKLRGTFIREVLLEGSERDPVDRAHLRRLLVPPPRLGGLDAPGAWAAAP